MKQSVIIDIGSSKVLAMVVCPAADGAIIVQNAEERTYSGYRFGELPNAAALSDTLDSIASVQRSLSTTSQSSSSDSNEYCFLESYGKEY